jgi:hypothetical protein
MPCFEASRSTATSMAANSDHRPSRSYRALTFSLISAVALVLGSGVAHASTIAHFSCLNYSSLPGAAQAIAPTDVTVNVSAFDVPLVNLETSGSQSTGAGAGKITFQTAQLTVGFSNFRELSLRVADGGTFQACILSAKLDNGDSVQCAFNSVIFTSVTAVASSAVNQSQPDVAYATLTLSHGGLFIRRSTGSDDGGTGAQPTSPSGSQSGTSAPPQPSSSSGSQSTSTGSAVHQ